VVFVDHPLLFEMGSPFDYSEIWLIYASHETRVNRIMNRDKITREYAEKKIASQLPLESKIELSTRVIENNSTLGALHELIDKCIQKAGI